MTGWKETPVEAAARITEWRQGVGDWLQQFAWDHWITLTVRGAWSPQRLQSAFESRYLRWVTKELQQRVPHFLAIEGGALGDRPHLHALLGGTARLTTRALESRWNYGRADVAVFNPVRGAAHYLAKEIGSTVLHYDVSRILPSPRIWTSRQEPIHATPNVRTATTHAHH